MFHTYCPYEIAYTNDKGVIDDFGACIGFGGDMGFEEYDEEKSKFLIKEWEAICKKKINEAYKEYMEFKEMRDWETD